MEKAANNLITAKDVAQWLNVPLATVYEKTRTGELPHVRLGRLVRYDRNRLEQFIDTGGTQK
jgi:excisionase family DNA binding protein